MQEIMLILLTAWKLWTYKTVYETVLDNSVTIQ